MLGTTAANNSDMQCLKPTHGELLSNNGARSQMPAVTSGVEHFTIMYVFRLYAWYRV